MSQPAVQPGRPDPLGVSIIPGGINVAVLSRHATSVEFCVFDDSGAETTFRLTERSGDILHGEIVGIGLGQRYGLRAHGPWVPERGHRFNPNKLLIDPYALALDSVPKYHPALLAADDVDSAPFVPKAIICQPESSAAALPLVPWDRTVIYEAHVRGLTMRHAEIPPELRGTFAGMAHPAMIAHLKTLGVTTLEILPPCAWIEERHLAERQLPNYWGYNTTAFLTPDPRLAPGGWAEVRTSVAALAAAGIETIVDIVLNHTGEGDEHGITLSLRGLDNALYFRAGQLEPWTDANDSGCGNTLAIHRPAGVRLAMDTLRAWARFGGVHGFRFDLATILARREDGYDPEAPFLQAIEQDPELGRLKLIAEPWDCGPGGWQTGNFPAIWGEWNDRFRDDIRRFWRGDHHMVGALATRLAGSEDLFGPRHRPSRSINFVTAHDGFTLADLVSHTEKHNAANEEGNRDGTSANNSWNHGVEGATDNAEIIQARLADQRALLALTILARGTPMLSMGSEFGQTQHGNNNAYAQDNETTWLDWAHADTSLAAWTTQIIQLRADLPAFRADRFLTGKTLDGEPAPDVVWLRPDGHAMGEHDWHAHDAGVLVVLLCHAGQRVAFAINRTGEEHAFALPLALPGLIWTRHADSALVPKDFVLSPRSVQVWAEHPLPETEAATDDIVAQSPPTPAPAAPPPPSAANDDLARLADAAGLAREWWETDGKHHRTSPDTQRALLTSLGLATGSAGEVRDSLAYLAAEGRRRPLPTVLVLREGQPGSIALAVEPGTAPRSTWLCIELESGEQQRVRAGTGSAALTEAVAEDGLACQHWHIDLPALPLGHHRVWREDATGAACHLTVAPARCYLPPALAEGERRFGISAQLYALRSAKDQGIGDFTTLRLLMQQAGKAGAAAVAVNPMHALFPDQRERASPYQPSDRRFLDPIYLDVPEALWAAAGPRGKPAVDYPQVWALKSLTLEQRFNIHQGSAGFLGFRAMGGQALADFALFQAISEAHPGMAWQQWPSGLRQPGSRDCAEFTAAHLPRIAFHSFLQYLADLGLADASKGLEIGLIRDLAVGCAPDGAEAWALGDRVAHGVSIGAPPDPFAAEGQVWGLPPPNPLAMRRTGYADFRSLLTTNLRHAGGLRIDHALGLARLFFVPEGGSAADGTYVAYPFQDLLGEIALASQQAQALIIAEDLGTVPDGLREALTAHDMLSYRLLLLERDGPEFRATNRYPRRAVACVSTHDLPTFQGWLEGADIAERIALGLTAAPMAEREAEIDALQRVAGDGDLTAAAHHLIAQTPSDLAYVQAEDLGGERVAVNLPGTDRERPNWRHRIATPIETLFTTPHALTLLDEISLGRLDDSKAA